MANPPPSKPRRVRGGIKAQSKRGAFAERWWAKRWIAVLEGFGLGARLARGRSYARQGQVTQISIEPDGVRAEVQGSRRAPYSVTIQVKPLSVSQWRLITDAIMRTPRFAAMLLNGQMPEDIEDAFREAQCELFPQSITDVRTDCSCPDWSNPCKHVAVVYYLIGEEFDRDPFLLFALRGRTRRDILATLTLDDEPSPEIAPYSGASGADCTRAATTGGAPAGQCVAAATSRPLSVLARQHFPRGCALRSLCKGCGTCADTARRDVARRLVRRAPHRHHPRSGN